MLTALGPNWFSLNGSRAGAVIVRIHFSPYWKVVEGSACVEPAGQFTGVMLRRSGPVKVAIRFSLMRIGSRSQRCS
jgi:hypothetical protein